MPFQCSLANLLTRVSCLGQSCNKSMLKENFHTSDIPLHMGTLLIGFHPDLAWRLILLW